MKRKESEPGTGMRRALRGAAAAILFALFAGAAPAQTLSIAQLNDDGLKAYKANDFAHAVEDFRAAHNRRPEDPALLNNLIQSLNGWAVALGQSGDYSTAISRLVEARRIDPNAAVVGSNLAVLRVNFAVSEMDRGNLSTAEELLAQAYESADPKDVPQIDDRRAQLYLLRARMNRKDGDEDLARDNLKRSLQLSPTFVPSLLEMADLLYHRGDNVEALAYYQEARDQNPNIEGLQPMIDKIMREEAVEGDFKKRSNSYFTIAFEGDVDRKAADSVLDTLWHAYREIGRELDHFPSGKIPVVLYRGDQYKTATIAPDWTGALFDGKIRVPVPDGDFSAAVQKRLRESLYHEYTHALIDDMLPHNTTIPTWLNEGLACYFQLDRDARQRRDEEDRPVLARLKRSGKLAPPSQLPADFVGIADPQGVEQAYRVSRDFVDWLATHYRTVYLRQLLEAVADGKSIEDAFKDVYRRGLKDLETDWMDDLGG